MLEYSGAAILKLATFSNDFLKLSINDIIWGYDDSFTRFGYALKSILKPSDEGIKKFGILTVVFISCFFIILIWYLFN